MTSLSISLCGTVLKMSLKNNLYGPILNEDVHLFHFYKVKKCDIFFISSFSKCFNIFGLFYGFIVSTAERWHETGSEREEGNDRGVKQIFRGFQWNVFDINKFSPLHHVAAKQETLLIVFVALGHTKELPGVCEVKINSFTGLAPSGATEIYRWCSSVRTKQY